MEMKPIGIGPEAICAVALNEALEALDYFRATGDRAKFREWNFKWNRVIKLLEHTIKLGAMAGIADDDPNPQPKA